jgi:hypothetical protein
MSHSVKAKQSQAKQSQTKPSKAKQSQAKPNKANQSQPKPSFNLVLISISITVEHNIISASLNISFQITFPCNACANPADVVESRRLHTAAFRPAHACCSHFSAMYGLVEQETLDLHIRKLILRKLLLLLLI